MFRTAWAELAVKNWLYFLIWYIYRVNICRSLFNISLGAGKVAVQEEFRKQIKVFVEAGLDFLLCEVTCLMIGSTCLLSGSH